MCSVVGMCEEAADASSVIRSRVHLHHERDVYTGTIDSLVSKDRFLSGITCNTNLSDVLLCY